MQTDKICGCAYCCCKNKSKTRWQDTKSELRIRLRKTMDLQSTGYSFYHEDAPKEEQIVSVTTAAHGEALDVVLFTDKIKKLLNDK